MKHTILEKTKTRTRYLANKHVHAQAIQKTDFSIIMGFMTNNKDDEKKLFEAVENGDYTLCKQLLEKGVSANTVSPNNNWSVLHTAASRGFFKISELLLDHGADLDAQFQGPFGSRSTPLLVAAEEGRDGCVGVFLERGADIECRDCFRNTPLHLAARHGYVHVVKALLAKKANRECLNEWLETPLMSAAKKGRDEIIPLLLEGVDDDDVKRMMEERAKSGRTIVHLAADEGHPNTVALLVQKYNANVNAKDADGRTPLHLACGVLTLKPKFATVATLLGLGADNAKDDKLILEMACQGNASIVSLLITYGANLEAMDSSKRTPLHHACIWNRVETARVLLKAGANANNTNYCLNETPLYEAAKRGFVELVKLLLEYGAKPDIPDYAGKTARDNALKGGHTEIVELLTTN